MLHVVVAATVVVVVVVFISIEGVRFYFIGCCWRLLFISKHTRAAAQFRLLLRSFLGSSWLSISSRSSNNSERDRKRDSRLVQLYHLSLIGTTIIIIMLPPPLLLWFCKLLQQL